MHFSTCSVVALFTGSAAAWSLPLWTRDQDWHPHTWRPQGWQSKPVAWTAEGIVEGAVVKFPHSSKTAHKFLGIPFASPPERFSPPEPPKKRREPLSATKPPPSCLQQFKGPTAPFIISAFASPPPPSESEDCLYLNVYTPSIKPPKGGFPVLFWIYGGSLEFGYSDLPLYNGSNFAAFQDVIVVTTNYRMNVFGFPNSPSLPVDKQNLGLMDQRMALDWTSKNIKGFGGDPSKVTIFGESAGGFSVKQLVAVPPKPLNFRAAILESEANAGKFTGAQSWEMLMEAINCTTGDQLACARAVPATTIQRIEDLQSLNFTAVPDNITMASNVTTAITSGAAADVPIIIGSNYNDGFVFALAFKTVSQFLDTFVSAGVPHTYLNEVLAQYPDSEYPSATLKISAIITDLEFQCPAAMIADLTAKRGINAYRYIYNASFANNQPDGVEAGAWHSSEIPEVFGTYNRTGHTKQQVDLSRYMKKAWADFAKDPCQGPASDWPAVGKASAYIQTFQSNATASGVAGPALPPAVADAKCAILAPAIAKLGL